MPGQTDLGLCSQPPRDSGPAPGPPEEPEDKGRWGACGRSRHCPRLCAGTPRSASGTSPLGFCPLSGTHPTDLDHLQEDSAVPWPPAPGAHPGPASCLFRELSTRTRRASLLPSTQTAHSTRSTDLTSPQTLEEQLGERFREEFCETVCNTTDCNTTVLNTMCTPLNIGDLGSPQSTQGEPGRHPGGLGDSGREGPGQAGAPGPARTHCEVHGPFHCGQTPALQHQQLVSTKKCPSGSFPGGCSRHCPTSLDKQHSSHARSPHPRARLGAQEGGSALPLWTRTHLREGSRVTPHPTP